MVRIHREGFTIILGTILLLVIVNLAVSYFAPHYLMGAFTVSVILFFIILQFFRNPVREIVVADDNIIYAPADGKIVVIEETQETEYFKDKRLQISIFMSPTNVHVNRNPISGTINYFKHHQGKYLVAWHPKSSSENERTTTVIDTGKCEILVRQIAGALAKRIVNYVDVGERITQGNDMGFIKFGSRVDLFLPLGSEILVEMNQKVKGNKTIIAKIR